jgi:hypothetical protein
MKKKTPPDGPIEPLPRLQDMSLSDVAKLNVEAVKTGDTSKLMRVLENAIEPDPPYDPGANYTIDLPILRRDGERAIGLKLAMLYPGEGPELAIETPDGHIYVVSLPRINGIVDALRGAMYAAPPRPMIYAGPAPAPMPPHIGPRRL